MENYRSTHQREFLKLFRAGREGQGKEIALAEIFRRNARSEGAAEGGCGGNSAAPERSAGAKRRRSVRVLRKMGSDFFKQTPLSIKNLLRPGLNRFLIRLKPA